MGSVGGGKGMSEAGQRWNGGDAGGGLPEIVVEAYKERPVKKRSLAGGKGRLRSSIPSHSLDKDIGDEYLAYKRGTRRWL